MGEFGYCVEATVADVGDLNVFYVLSSSRSDASAVELRGGVEFWVQGTNFTATSGSAALNFGLAASE